MRIDWVARALQRAVYRLPLLKYNHGLWIMRVFESVVPVVPPLDRALTAIAGVQKMTPHARLYMRQVLLAYAAVRAGHKLRQAHSFWEAVFLKDLVRIGNRRFILPEGVHFRENNYMEILRLIRSRQFLSYVVSVEALPELQGRFYMVDGHVTANFLSLLISSDNGRALIQAIIGHRIFHCMDNQTSIAPKQPWLGTVSRPVQATRTKASASR